MSKKPVESTYRIVATPIRALLLVATETGLVRVAFECEGFDAVLTDLESKLGSAPVEAAADDADSPSRDAGGHLDRAASELGEYFEGRRHDFSVTLDRRLSTGFRERVHAFLSKIPHGRTVSYADVAEHVENAGAVRAVGSACGRNPIPVVVPCHRVVRSDGSLGGYLGGLEAKEALLRLEGAR